MKKYLFIILFSLTSCIGMQAQTNILAWYKTQENTIEFAPTISAGNIFKPKTFTIGQSFEYEHWTTPYLGTGLELGNYNYKVLTYGIIDHMSINADYRIVLFPTTQYLDRFALGLKTGAETYFVDGSKDIEFGVEGYYTFTPRLRLEADIIQHVRTKAAEDGETARIAFQWLFN